MAGRELDMVDEILGPQAASKNDAPELNYSKSAPMSETKDSRPTQPRFRLPSRPHLGNPFARLRLPARSQGRPAGFAIAFTLGAVACLALFAAISLAVLGAQSNRAMPGVHVGTLDVSGLSRDQVVARLRTTYAYLGDGKITVTTPAGPATATYKDLGRTPDVEFMADEAMRVGHSGNAIADAAAMLRSAVGGTTIPVVVRVDPTAIATSIRHIAAANVPPTDAKAYSGSTSFGKSPSALGSGIDEVAISEAVIAHLTDPNAPAEFQVGSALVVLQPKVTEKDAEAAIARAQKMLVEIRLTFTMTPAIGATQAAAPKFAIVGADQVTSWITFGVNGEGTYGPNADPSLMESYLSSLSPQVRTAPVEPTIIFNGSGAPAGMQGGKDGSDIDVKATAKAIAAYLNSLAAGGQSLFDVTAVTTPISPNLTPESFARLVNIGAWTTIFYPDISNGFGANIRNPAKILNGRVIAPGQQFSFLEQVGPIDIAHGFALGGVIENGKSNHTGAMGGGICSASTTFFNAAARAGLQIDERHAHFYYITRYPLGLDATVFSNGYQLWDMKWTNDTANPIIIVSGSTYGVKSTITVQLWSLPLDRKVDFSPEVKTNVARAMDKKVSTPSLPLGTENRTEYPSDGFDTFRTRTVTDSNGNVIHSDTWTSHYARVDGMTLVGTGPPAPNPPPNPPPPAPADAVLPPGVPGAAGVSQAPRSRKLRGVPGR